MSKSNKSNKSYKSYKNRWLGLESYEAFTDPVKDPDPGGKIHDKGIKIVIARTNIKTGNKQIRGEKKR